VLTGPDEAAIRRGALLVEDALRTASLPEADGGRVYVLRRLSLGTIDAGAPPASVALAIERRFAALKSAAVHVAAAGAGRAEAVYFHDELEPLVHLLRAGAEGRGPEGWFWPLAVRGVVSGMPGGLAIRTALARACDSPAGAAAVIRVVAGAVAEEGRGASGARLDAICAALTPGDGDALLARMGWGGLAGGGAAAVAAMADGGGAAPAPAPAGAWPAALRRWAGTWGLSDRRTAWLAGIALTADAPALAADPRLAARVTGLLTGVAAAALAALSGPPEPRLPAGSVGRDDAIELSGMTDGADAVSAPGAPAPVGADDASPPPSAPPDVVSGRPDDAAPTTDPLPAADGAVAAPAADRPALADPEPADAPAASRRRAAPWVGIPTPTAAGGLLFLIRPLARLGLPRWIAAAPDRAGFAAALLLHVARGAGVDADDPIFAILAPDPGDPGAADRGRYRDLVTWRLALAGWSRRRLERPLAAIVRRPGRIVATPTHIDLLFPLRDADHHLRASGLDVDPGWVPWLGRVVQFHYLEQS
jgi:hypothetical protein